MLPSYYYERKKRKKQRLILVGFLITILLLVVLVMWAPQKTATPAAEILQQPKPTVLAKTATLKLSTLYACGHQRSRLFPIPEELESKNKEEIALLHPDWNILRFEEELLEAEEKLDTD